MAHLHLRDDVVNQVRRRRAISGRHAGCHCPHQAQRLGLLLHKLGALLMLLALGWAGWLLVLQHGRRAGVVIDE